MNEENLFQNALAKPRSERAAFLDETCAGMPDVRAAVETLLASHEATAGSFDPSAGDLAATALSNASQQTGGVTDYFTVRPNPASITAGSADHHGGPAAGFVISGRYVLEGRIGEGGMGEVWSAKQTEPVKRKVALKLIKPGMDSRAVLQRFEQERQALALMDHPNIAKVLDGGLTPNGQPFFVMELVNGLPLTKFCDEAKLTPKERLELFVPICQAVQHAHQKGIVHRDLKPANILVARIDGKPVPKVIDFGVAKATAGKLTDESLATQLGAVVGTLDYMSPEQAGFSAEDIDTRSDIYSLGVILYELLTGLRPTDVARLKKAALTEMIRIIREEEPSKPSTRLSTDAALPSLAALRQTEPRKLMTMLKGELDWVVMKCLEKERDRRYETANGLARDIQRFLADEVVEARPASAGYRLRKFANRHRGQVVAASLVVLSLVLGIVGTTWGLIRAARANAALAAANADLTAANAKVHVRYNLAVDAIKTFHTGVSEDFLLREQKFSNLRDRLLKSASDFYGTLSALLGSEPDRASRRALAAANFELADLTAKVGRNADALAAHRSVLAARRELAADPRAGAAAQAEVGRSLTEIAGLLESGGQTELALTAYREAEGLLSEAASSSLEARAALAACRSRMGGFLTSIGKNAEALAAYRLARSDQEKVVAAAAASPQAHRELGDTINRIGRLLANTGRPREATTEYRAALAIREKLGKHDPADSEFRNALGASHNNLGLVLWQTGRLKEAEAEYRTSLAIREKLAADNPAVSEFRQHLQASHFNLANLLRQTGRLKEAEDLFRSALAIERELAQANPAVPEFRRLLALNHHSLATVLKRTGQNREAEAEFRAALSMLQALVTANPAVTQYRSDLGSTHSELGVLLAESSRSREAETEFRAGVANDHELARANPVVTEFRNRLATSHVNLGELLSEAGRSSESEAEYSAAEAIFRDLAGANPAVTYFRYGLAYTQVRRGIQLSQTGRLKEADAVFRSATEIYQALADQSPKVPDYADGLASALTRKGDVVRSSGRASEARDTYDRAIALRERLVKQNPTAPVYLGSLAFSLRRGMARRDLGDPAAAAADVRRALTLYAGLATRSGEEWFETACCHAALAGMAGVAGSGVPAAQGAELSTHAMSLLHKAVGKGYRNVSTFRNESALDPLRDRADFPLLVMDLALPAEPFARPD